MIRDDVKTGLFVQRYLGGMGRRNVVVTPWLVVLYDLRWSYEQAFGTFVKQPEIPHCNGLFSVTGDGSTSLELWTIGSLLTADDILKIIAKAFDDNQDEAMRFCGNPTISIDGVSHGTVRNLRQRN